MRIPELWNEELITPSLSKISESDTVLSINLVILSTLSLHYDDRSTVAPPASYVPIIGLVVAANGLSEADTIVQCLHWIALGTP